MKFTIFILLFIISFSSIDAQVVRDEFNKGKRYFKLKDYKKAKQKFNFVIANNTAYHEAYTYRARIYLATNMPDSALRDFKTSISKREDFIPNYYYRAKYYISIGNDYKAEKDLNTLLSYKPDFAAAILMRAIIYEKNGDEERAFQDYNSLIEKKTKNYKVYYQRGLYYSKHKNNNAAIKDFESALSLKQNYTDALFALGNSHQVLGHNAEAIKSYSKVIDIDQTYQQAYERRAYLYYKDKNYTAGLEDDRYIVSYFRLREDTLFIRMAKAELGNNNTSSADRYLTKALSANPKSIDALLLRSDVALKRDRASTALSYLQRIHRIDAKNTESWYKQGQIQMKSKQYQKAIDAYSNCVKIEPIAKAYYMRGAAYNYLRKPDEACKDTRKAASLGHRQAKRDLPRICK